MDQFKIELVFTVLADWEREAEADGWTVDHTCWPWLAYRGPRFDPDAVWPFGGVARRNKPAGQVGR